LRNIQIPQPILLLDLKRSKYAMDFLDSLAPELQSPANDLVFFGFGYKIGVVEKLITETARLLRAGRL